jgi:uncharacterized YccA/Bax inhibitor family protein
VWKRLIATLIAMVIASLVAGLLWHSVFDVRMPSYLSGVIGGLAALGVWELLRSR